MKFFRRNSKGAIANWWWTVDHQILAAVTILMVIGIFLIFTASPSVANRINVDSFRFLKRQLFFATFAYGFMIFLSMQSLTTIRRLGFFGFFIAIGFMVATFFFGMETKGAARWIDLGFISIQPSEFVKPFFVILTAWIFDTKNKTLNFPGNTLAIVAYILTVGLLLMQPDVGMTIVVTLIWIFQYFLAGLNIAIIAILGASFLICFIIAYFTFGHVKQRVDQFLDQDTLSYQVQRSLEAFESGSILGRGAGEGIVKLKIPDAHTDFIFAVAGEEFGIFLCLLIIALFAFIVIRTMLKSLKDKNLFIILSSSGLAASFGLQGFINMGSTLHLLPTKGMALPLISYGGSSLLASATLLGMLLAITRKNVYAEDKDYG